VNLDSGVALNGTIQAPSQFAEGHEIENITFGLQPSAFGLQPSAFSLQPSAFRLRFSATC
jgi:hypothetical protein